MKFRELDKRDAIIYQSLVLGSSSAHIRDKSKQLLLANEKIDLTAFKVRQTECRKKGIDIVTFCDSIYPKLLKEIPDFPAVLYCRGNLNLLKDSNTVAMVGSRKASDYGLNIARNFSAQIAQAGIVVISGMALGIDTACHKGALSMSGKTIAVLGTAIDQLYPHENEKLGEMIISKGLVVSEYPPGFKTAKFHFPMRNRIIAGLSRSVVIVEASQKSGALITAFLAVEYNRNLYAVPSDVGKILGQGSNYLISRGATCLISPETVVEDMGFVPTRKRLILTRQEVEVLKALKSGLGFDKITKKLKMSSSQLNVVLLELEIKGLVKRLGNSFKVFD